MSDSTREFPRTACAMPLQAVSLQRSEESGVRHSFEMVINTGKEMRHPYWGKFGIDLGGVQAATKRVPVLLDHDGSKRVGFMEPGEYQVTDRGLEPPAGKGQLLKTNADVQRLMQDFEEGFPFQASPMIEPTVLEEVGEGATVDLNGEAFEGPGTIFRESRILENSFVSVGQDDDTAAALLSREGATTLSATLIETMETNEQTEEQTEEVEGTEEVEATEETTETEAAASSEGETADPVQMERERASAIVGAAGPHQTELAQQLVTDGVSFEDAIVRLQRDSVSHINDLATANAGDQSAHSAAPREQPATAELSAEQEWERNPKLHREFSDFEYFKAWRQASKNGRARILGGSSQN